MKFLNMSTLMPQYEPFEITFLLSYTLILASITFIKVGKCLKPLLENSLPTNW